jgi:hypothetical protein
MPGESRRTVEAAALLAQPGRFGGGANQRALPGPLLQYIVRFDCFQTRRSAPRHTASASPPTAGPSSAARSVVSVSRPAAETTAGAPRPAPPRPVINLGSARLLGRPPTGAPTDRSEAGRRTSVGQPGLAAPRPSLLAAAIALPEQRAAVAARRPAGGPRHPLGRRRRARGCRCCCVEGAWRAPLIKILIARPSVITCGPRTEKSGRRAVYAVRIVAWRLRGVPCYMREPAAGPGRGEQRTARRRRSSAGGIGRPGRSRSSGSPTWRPGPPRR